MSRGSPRPGAESDEAVQAAERAIECEMYLEPTLAKMADAAVIAGWTDDEVEAALLKLIKARILAGIRVASDEAIVPANSI